MKLYLFGAEWCPACSAMEPIAEKVCKEMDANYEKIDVGAEPDKATRARVMSLPTFIITREGEEIARHVGTAPESWLRDMLK